MKEKQNEIVPDSNSNLAKSMTHHNQIKELSTWFLKVIETKVYLPSGVCYSPDLESQHC
jgi:hypothetical protein